MKEDKVQYKLRLPKDLHEWATQEAKERYQSLNVMFVEMLRLEKLKGVQDKEKPQCGNTEVQVFTINKETNQ